MPLVKLIQGSPLIIIDANVLYIGFAVTFLEMIAVIAVSESGLIGFLVTRMANMSKIAKIQSSNIVSNIYFLTYVYLSANRQQ